MRFLAVSTLLGILLGAGCKDSSIEGDSAREAMSLYAQGFNKLLEDPQQMINTYFDRVSDDGPRPGKKVHLSSSPFASSRIKEAKQAFTEAKERSPDTLKHLGPLSDQVIVAIEKAENCYTEAHKYYQAEDYKDDQWAKGKELHARMQQSSKEFQEALGKLGNGLSEIEDKQALSELAKYENPKDYSYWFRSMNIRAKQLLDSIGDSKAFQERFKSAENAGQELAQFTASKADKINAAFESYVSLSDSFLASAKKINRALDEKADFAAVGAELPKELVNRYNNMINLSNSLLELEGYGQLK